MELLSIQAHTQLWKKIVFMVLLDRDRTRMALLINATAHWRFLLLISSGMETQFFQTFLKCGKNIPDPKPALSVKSSPNSYCQPFHAVLKLLSISDATIIHLSGAALRSYRNRLQTHILRMTCFCNSKSQVQDQLNIQSYNSAVAAILLMLNTCLSR